jgi:predicted nucleotidyltransferase
MASGTLQRTGERERVVELLRGRAEELRAQGISGLAVFGSVARDEAGPGSDVDLLIELDREAELGFGVVSLRHELDQLVGRPVGLAFASRISPDFRARIERDLVRVF